eukprot:4487447-Pyramimonas_sp.AAC.1
MLRHSAARVAATPTHIAVLCGSPRRLLSDARPAVSWRRRGHAGKLRLGSGGLAVGLAAVPASSPWA